MPLLLIAKYFENTPTSLIGNAIYRIQISITHLDLVINSRLDCLFKCHLFLQADSQMFNKQRGTAAMGISA